MGTILNGRVDVFRTIVAALAKHKDLQLVLSVGEQVDPKKIGPIPGQCHHRKTGATIGIAETGLGLYHPCGVEHGTRVSCSGCPASSDPSNLTYDQPGVAARIAHKQTGVVTLLDKLTADHLSELLNEVLSNPTYRDNARTLQKAIAEANGLSVAADLVEQSLGVRRPVKIRAATVGQH